MLFPLKFSLKLALLLLVFMPSDSYAQSSSTASVLGTLRVSITLSDNYRITNKVLPAFTPLTLGTLYSTTTPPIRYCDIIANRDDVSKCGRVLYGQAGSKEFTWVKHIQWNNYGVRYLNAAEKAVLTATVSDTSRIFGGRYTKLKEKELDLGVLSRSFLPEDSGAKVFAPRVVVMGFYDPLHANLAIRVRRTIHQYANQEVTLSVIEALTGAATVSGAVSIQSTVVSGWHVRSQDARIGPAHFDGLESVRAYIRQPTLQATASVYVDVGINPFRKFELDNTDTFYNINLAAAMVAVSHAKHLVGADTAYMVSIRPRLPVGKEYNIRNRAEAGDFHNGFSANVGYGELDTTSVVSLTNTSGGLTAQIRGGKVNFESDWFFFVSNYHGGYFMQDSFYPLFCANTDSHFTHKCSFYEVVVSKDAVTYLGRPNTAMRQTVKVLNPNTNTYPLGEQGRRDIMPFHHLYRQMLLDGSQLRVVLNFPHAGISHLDNNWAFHQIGHHGVFYMGKKFIAHLDSDGIKRSVVEHTVNSSVMMSLFYAEETALGEEVANGNGLFHVGKRVSFDGNIVDGQEYHPLAQLPVTNDEYFFQRLYHFLPDEKSPLYDVVNCLWPRISISIHLNSTNSGCDIVGQSDDYAVVNVTSTAYITYSGAIDKAVTTAIGGVNSVVVSARTNLHAVIYLTTGEAFDKLLQGSTINGYEGSNQIFVAKRVSGTDTINFNFTAAGVEDKDLNFTDSYKLLQRYKLQE